MKQPVAITGFSSVSALGSGDLVSDGAQISGRYDTGNHCLEFDALLDSWVGKLPEKLIGEINKIRLEDRNYENLDPSVLYALYVSRKAVRQAGWKEGSHFGINIGSSRGATQLFEKYHAVFEREGHSSTLVSPTTTLGNISSWVAQDLQNEGPEISHSITCSTAFHGLLNGVAWLQSGLCDKFLVGGSEAALTPFTIAQMRAMKTLAPTAVLPQTEDSFYPCRALDLDKSKNTMVLGEGAASVCLESGSPKNAQAYITGIGYATEKLKHAVSISADADCFQKSMRMAIQNLGENKIDAIVMHAPGTILGDMSEFKAIKKVFGSQMPLLTSNKWKIGHTFGASGLLSLELGILMLKTQKFTGVPFTAERETNRPLKNILVNAVGFGGNAVSILLSKA